MNPNRKSGLSRRSFLKGTALGGVSLAALPACAGTPKLPVGNIADPLAASHAFSPTLDVAALVEKLGDKHVLRLISGESLNLPGAWHMMLDYNRTPIVAGDLAELGIPGIRFTDGPRGVVMYNATCFPVAMARGATFDPALEFAVGDAIGREARALGANLWAGACVNLLRHPGWGRAQETYGEDPHHVGVMGAAVIAGVQQHIMACVKHLACNSIEDSRFSVDVQIDDRALREVYLVAFRHAIEAGVASVMSAYNKVNGVYCGHNRVLLTDILRGEMGFEGFVMSDFLLGIRDGVAALNAGLDLEMPFAWHAGIHLRGPLRAGKVQRGAVNQAAIRVLAQQVRFADPTGREYPRSVVNSAEHQALARKVATESMVLLRNERELLPLAKAKLTKVAVVGRLIDEWNIGDEGSSMVRPAQVTTIREGFAKALAADKVSFSAGDSLQEAAALAADADAAVVVVGFTHAEEGENIVIKGGDRRSLRLPEKDEALVLAVAARQPNTVVVMIGGSAIVTEAWRERVPGILMAWYPGMHGGHALADVILGDAAPGGKLPCVFPRDAAHLPHFDPDADSVVYDLFHGYRKLDADANDPAFAFGFGLGYTTFAVRDVTTQMAAELIVEATVENTGALAGSDVLQVYVGRTASRFARSPRELKGFKKVHLAAGSTERVRLSIPKRELAVWDTKARRWLVEPGTYQVWVGRSSRVRDLVATTIVV